MGSWHLRLLSIEQIVISRYTAPHSDQMKFLSLILRRSRPTTTDDEASNVAVRRLSTE